MKQTAHEGGSKHALQTLEWELETDRKQQQDHAKPGEHIDRYRNTGRRTGAFVQTQELKAVKPKQRGVAD